MMRGTVLLTLFGICLSECPPNSVFTHWELVDGTCYGIVKKSPSFLSAYDARESCLSFGGDIADITDSKLYSLTVSIMAQMPEVTNIELSNRFYIGSNDISEEGNYTLLSGQIMRYHNWGVGEPNNLVGDEDCIVVQTENSWKVNTTSWRDYPCCQNQKIPAVLCQMPENEDDRRKYKLEPRDNIFAEACHSEVDDCQENRCLNGGTCIDDLLDFQCKCPPERKGKLCEFYIKCAPFPTWRGLLPDSAENIFRTVVNYTCARGDFLSNGNVSALAVCNSSAMWDPPILDCRELESKEDEKQIKPTEAKNAVTIGTVALVFVVCEAALMVCMDLHTLRSHVKELKRNCTQGYLWFFCAAACNRNKQQERSQTAESIETWSMQFQD